MVANNCWGLSSRSDAIFSALDLLSLKLNKSAGLSEKYATSDPEMSAEQNNNINVNIIPVIDSKVKLKKVILRLLNITHWEKGSGSKIYTSLVNIIIKMEDHQFLKVR